MTTTNLQIRTSPDLAARFRAQAEERRLSYGELLLLLLDSEHAAGMQEHAGEPAPPGLAEDLLLRVNAMAERVGTVESRVEELAELLAMASGRSPGAVERRAPGASPREKLDDAGRAELHELDDAGIPKSGAELRTWIRTHGLTLAEIAEHAGVSRAAVQQWQASKSLRLRTRRRLAQAAHLGGVGAGPRP